MLTLQLRRRVHTHLFLLDTFVTPSLICDVPESYRIPTSVDVVRSIKLGAPNLDNVYKALQESTLDPFI
jgi:hypothetical protein